MGGKRRDLEDYCFKDRLQKTKEIKEPPKRVLPEYLELEEVAFGPKKSRIKKAHGGKKPR